jgi:uncharacterized RDD family membrane protein YckC
VRYEPGSHAQSDIRLPPWLRIAGIGARFGAWLLDLLFFGLVSAIPATQAVVSGAVTLNPEAVTQVGQNPAASPTVPYLVVDVGALSAWAAVWVALAIVYAAVCWAYFRGTPGQRILSLQIADAATGRNLSIARATWRAVLVSGIPAAAAAVLVVAMCQVLSVVIPADFQGSGGAAYLDESGVGGAWGGLVSLCGLAVWSWPLVLLLTAAFGRDNRGIHDRLAGSVVVARAKAPWEWGYPYGPAPGSPPGFGGQAPGWIPGYPAAPVPGAVPSDSPASAGPVPGPGPGIGPGPNPAEGPAPNEWPGVLPPGPPSRSRGFGPPTNGAQGPGGAVTGGEPSTAGRQGVLGVKLPEGLRIARFERRIRGYAIDCAIVFFVYLVIAALVEGASTNAEPLPDREAMIVGLASGLVQLVYFVATWWLWCGSIGQRIAGLQVVTESAGRLGPADALARWAILQGPFALTTAAPSEIGGAVVFVAVAWAGFLAYRTRDDPDGQGYHDRVAHSLVVEEI